MAFDAIAKNLQKHPKRSGALMPHTGLRADEQALAAALNIMRWRPFEQPFGPARSDPVLRMLRRTFLE